MKQFWAILMVMVTCVFALAGSQEASAQRRLWSADPNDVELTMLTTNVGDDIYDNFAHVAIRLQDKSTGRDIVFNWGIFDFGEPLSFALRFYRGILIYKLGVYPYQAASRQFPFDKRTVWQDKINLTPAEKTILLERMAWNLQPENVNYPYQYFFDNCATRPRDYLNEALGGSLKTLLEGRPTGQTYRDMVRSHYATNPFIAMSLEILMNGRIDRSMSVWEKMFLPMTLRDELRRVPSHVPGPDGRPLPLLSDEEVIVNFPERVPPPVTAWAVTLGAIAAPLALGVWATRKRAAALADGAWGSRLLGLCLLVWGFYAGIIGLLMPVAWLGSAHLDLHHNANMWLFWPLDLVYLVMGFTLLLRGRPWRLRPRALRFWRAYSWAHVAVIPVFILAWLGGLIQQDVSRVLLVFGPTTAAAVLFSLNKGMVRHER